MVAPFTDEHATRIIAALQTRIERFLRDGAKTATTWGVVESVSADNKEASVFLYDETDPDFASGGFRVGGAMVVSVGDTVKVAINYATGERWIEEVHVPPTDYKKIEIDVGAGVIATGDGTVPPTPLSFSVPDPLTIGTVNATNITVTNDLQVDDDITLAAGSVVTWATDVTLYRSVADLLKTDDEFEIGAAGGKDTLRLTSTSADTGITLGGDVVLFRSAADLLKTDDEFEVGFNGGKDTLRLTSTGTDTGITLGGDTNVYRSAANTLKTDDKFVAGATSSGKDQITIPDTTSGAGLTIGADTNLYRDAANELKTDDGLTVGAWLRGRTYGGRFSGTSGVTLTTSYAKLDLANTVDGESGLLVAASDQLTIPTGKGGLYHIHAHVKTSVALAGTTTFGVGIFINGASVVQYLNTVPASVDSGSPVSLDIVLAAGDTIDVRARAGAGVSAGAALTEELSCVMVGTDFTA